MSTCSISAFRTLCGVFAVFVVAACEVQPQLELVSSNLYVSQKKDISVAVVIPDSTRQFSTAIDIPGGCLGTIAFVPAPYGETFQQLLNDRFSRAFESVRIVPSIAMASDSDALFEATLTEVGQRFGCLASPDAFVRVKGGLRALDFDGRELWRSGRSQYEHHVGLLVADMNREVGQNISEGLSKLVDEWTQEVLQLPPQAYGVEGISEPAPRIATAAPRQIEPEEPAFPSAPLKIRFKKGPSQPDDIAVIIGNANYGKLGKDVPDVKPAYADAASFKSYAIRTLGIREGNIIDMRDATGAQINRVFGSRDRPDGQLSDWIRKGRSNVYVYYAGHGAPGGSDGNAYLIPSDADSTRIEINGYQLNTLYRNLGSLPAKSITVILEACFSGASQSGAVISNASPVYLKAKTPDIPKNITVISAGASDQMASWEEDGSNGLFTKYYLKGMSGEADEKPIGNGDGKVTDHEISEYLKETLSYYARRYYGRDQKAQIVNPKGG